MDVISELEKELIKFYKTSVALGGVIKEVYTYIPQNPFYPFAKINSINKKYDFNAIDGLCHIEVELSICTNCSTNATCLNILGKLDNIDMNDRINIGTLEHYYFKNHDKKILQNEDGLWRIDLSLSLVYMCV